MAGFEIKIEIRANGEIVRRPVCNFRNGVDESINCARYMVASEMRTIDLNDPTEMDEIRIVITTHKGDS